MKKKKNYRKWQVIFTLISLILVLAPITILMIVKRNTWLGGNGDIKIGYGFGLAMLFAVLILKGAFKKIHPTLNTIIWLSALLLITHLLNAILQDLFLIILCTIIGYISYIPFDILAKHNKRKADVMLDEKIKQEVRNNGWS